MGKFNILKVLKRGYKNKKKIYAFDVETWQEDKVNENNLQYKKQYFYMGCIKGDDDTEKTFFNQEDMKDELLSRKYRDSMIFATNLDFDFNILFGGDKRFKNALFIDRGGIIFIKLKIGKHYWQFFDTLAYTKFGVQALGDMLNMDKLVHPTCFKRKAKTVKETRELIDYCMQDANISYRFAKYFQHYCNNLGMKMKVTIASTGLDYWRRYYQNFDLFQERREWLNMHYEGSFKGGRTEVFKRGLFDKVFGYDFKSMYPSVCKEGIDGKGNYPNPNKVMRIKNGGESYIKEFEGVSKVKIYCPYMYIPLLCIHDLNKKLYFPYGEFEGWFTHFELRKALEIGYKILHVYDTLYYTSVFIPFKNIVTKLYDLRKKYKRENNKIMTQLVKDQMNSGIFGKFAQRIENKTEMFFIDDIHADINGEVYVIKDGKHHYLDNYTERGNYVFNNIKMPLKIPNFIFPILSSYTTAMARVKLWNSLVKYPDNIIYTDTDSLWLDKKMFNDSQELGKLEYLGKYYEAIFVKPKQYCLKNNEGDSYIKLKGVPKRYLSNKKDFMSILSGNSVFMERFTKVKESSIRKLPYGSIIEIEKRLSCEDNKRFWKDKFSYIDVQDSKPLKMIEGLNELEYENRRFKAEQDYKKQQEKLLDIDSDEYEERLGDFFDSMGDDITKEEFLSRESDYRDFE